MNDDNTPIDLRAANNMAQKALREAGVELRQNFGKSAHTTKAHAGDIVTELDRKTERYLANQFKAFDPAIGFRGEEFGVHAAADTTWLVDPIDGTAQFVRGLAFCTSMVALIHEGQPVIGLIYDFVRDEMYSAIKGEGAFCNDEPIKVSDRPLDNGFVSLESNLTLPGNADLALKLQRRTVVFRTINCGYEFSMVASGRIEARIAKDPYGEDWDFAPGSLLVQEAGGIVTNLGATTYDYKNHDYIAANPVIYQELVTSPQALFPLS
jgi:myo-inositol-1(or 4)-monophosphatase